MSILPSFLSKSAELGELKREKSPPREYGIDFATGKLTGKIVEGKEAIKVWIWLCLHTERYRYSIYSWDYGTSLEQYIGQGLTEEYIRTDCESEITEALLIHPNIESIEDFSVLREEDRLQISFRAITDFGELEVTDNV